jgi:hypothetical protein
MGWSESFLILLCDGCLAEKQQIQVYFVVFGLTKPGIELTIYNTQDKHTNNYTSDEII